MVKHFCDRCGKEMSGFGNYVVAELRIRKGLPRGAHDIELCMDCVDKAFGNGFAARCEVEYAEKKKAAQERMAARKAQKEQEG